jgi:GntR family transcriptional regulator
MQIYLDFRSGIPIYVQIIEQIKHLIATGELLPGDQLPTVRQLANDLRVNFNTIARAYRILDDAGVISTQHGRGTYILMPRSDEAVERMRNQALDSLTRQYLAKAARLAYSPDEIDGLMNKYLLEWKQKGLPVAIEAEEKIESEDFNEQEE